VLEGEWWRLVTAVFLHGSFDHLLGNCLILYIVGMACEHGLGTLRTVALYAASGLAGSLASLAMSPGPSVGASGAIFGLTGAAVAFLYRHQRLYHVHDKRVGFVLAGWAGYTLLIGLVTPLVDNAAPVGGAVAGVVMGLVFAPRAARELRAVQI
jgi:rhomboid protease GluP